MARNTADAPRPRPDGWRPVALRARCSQGGRLSVVGDSNANLWREPMAPAIEAIMDSCIAAENELVTANLRYYDIANCRPDDEAMNTEAFEDLQGARERFVITSILQQAAELNGGDAEYSALSDSIEAGAYLDALRTIVACIEATA